MCIYFKIQNFHGVKENRGISGYDHQIERCLLWLGRISIKLGKLPLYIKNTQLIVISILRGYWMIYTCLYHKSMNEC